MRAEPFPELLDPVRPPLPQINTRDREDSSPSPSQGTRVQRSPRYDEQ